MTNKNTNNNMNVTNELLTPEQFNKKMALMLSCGYILCAIVSFFLGNWMLSYTGDIYNPNKLAGSIGLMQEWFPFAAAFESIFFVPIIVCVICYVAMYFTANKTVQTIIFLLSALNLSPVLSAIYMFFSTTVHLGEAKNTTVSGMHMTLFWLLIAVYTIILFAISKLWDRFFSKARYVAATAIIYTTVMTLLAGMFTGLWLIAFIGFLLFTMYVGLNWFHSYQAARGCNKYYAITEGCRIMNFFGTAFDMKGKTAPTFVQR